MLLYLHMLMYVTDDEDYVKNSSSESEDVHSPTKEEESEEEVLGLVVPKQKQQGGRSRTARMRMTRSADKKDEVSTLFCESSFWFFSSFLVL